MSHVTHIDSAEIIIRADRAEDRGEIDRVAGRDSGGLPAGPLLVATVGDDVRAAISLVDGTVIADPFHRTAELIEMLRIRAGAVSGAGNAHAAPRWRSRHRPLPVGRAA